LEIFTVLDRSNSSATDRATDRISALALQILAKRGIDRPLIHDEDLTKRGLSSLDTVNLMLAVEAEFNIKIPDRDMTPANFRTIARIEALVGTLLNKPRSQMRAS
jgi:acyl carrier protein